MQQTISDASASWIKQLLC